MGARCPLNFLLPGSIHPHLSIPGQTVISLWQSPGSVQEPACQSGWGLIKQQPLNFRQLDARPKTRANSGQLLVLSWVDTGVPQAVTEPGTDVR